MNLRYTLSALALLGIAVGGCDSATLFSKRYSPVSISGRVTTTDDDPLSGVELTWYRETTQDFLDVEPRWERTEIGRVATNADGRYTIADRPRGEFASVRYGYEVDFCPNRTDCPYARAQGVSYHPEAIGGACASGSDGTCRIQHDIDAVSAP